MRLLIASLIFFSLLSCQRERVWVEPNKSQEADPNMLAEKPERIILCAPAAMDAIKDVYPDAAQGYARQVINWLKPQVSNTHFIYGPTLPPADAAVWNNGVYPGAKGAHLVVLVSLDKLEEVSGMNGPSGARTDFKATVAMRLINSKGKEIWTKSNTAAIANDPSPKFRGSASPAGRAVWNANFENINALKDFFDANSDKNYFGAEVMKKEEPKPAMVKLLIESEPAGADVLVDGVFKGNTPLRVELPLKEVEIKIERAGHETWSRKLVPGPEVQIKPVLSPKP